MKKIIALLIFSFAFVQGEEIANYPRSQTMNSNANIVHLTDGDFDRTIQTSKVPVVVDIYATWCGACKMVSPVIDELNQQYAGRVLFAKVDVDSQPSFVQRFQVTGMPTLLFFRPGNNNPVYRQVGYMSKQDFEQKINETLMH
ncbi:MAG TPA: thioredoxin [Chlamydiales bacterium]|nr:thioredoxin [Chlamydiales bacterium]